MLNLQHTLNECVKYLNREFTPEVIIDEEEAETNINKVLKVFRIMQTYLRKYNKIETQLNYHFNS